MAADQNDTKFYASDNVSILNASRMRMSLGSWVEWWVEIPSMTTTSYIIQCFNYSGGTGTYLGNISNTFKLFQDNGEYGTGKWAVTSGSMNTNTAIVAEGSTSLVMNSTSTQCIARNTSLSAYPANVTIGYLIYAPTAIPGSMYVAAPWSTATDIDYSRVNNDNTVDHLPSGSWAATGMTLKYDAWTWVEQRYNMSAGGTKVSFFQDGVLKGNTLGVYQNTASFNKLGIFDGGTAGANYLLYADYIYVRNYQQYEPVITIGATMYPAGAPATNTINITAVNVSMTNLGVTNEVWFDVKYANATTTSFS
jgi:hypothetical protein